MTGFAATELAVGARKIVWEIRSVNHRFLDLGFRLPEDFRALEVRLRSLVGAEISRGKVDCTLKVVVTGAEANPLELDQSRLKALHELEKHVLERFPSAGNLSVAEVLRWPGVLKEESALAEDLSAPALASFSEAVAGLKSAREREGRRLGELLTERLDAIAGLLEGVDGLLDTAAPRYRDKLLERVQKLDVEVDQERLEQELALIAQRVDVREEADRLRSHLSEIRDVLHQSEPIGRRLDFLIQELNREANTFASKVQDEELARRAVDLKVLIEQMREQVQNIE
jgi:uncharacterized protein (TIGR00255 family)